MEGELGGRPERATDRESKVSLTKASLFGFVLSLQKTLNS